MSETCSATTKEGNPCRAPAVIGSPYCAMQGNPGRAAELGRMGGRRNGHYVETPDVTFAPPSTPEEVKTVLAQSMVDVHAGKLHRRIAHALTYMGATLLKAMEVTDLQGKLARALEELRAARAVTATGNVATSPLASPPDATSGL